MNSGERGGEKLKFDFLYNCAKINKGGKMRILMAEDSQEVWDLFRRFAKLGGHEIVIVENGDEALKELESGQEFDVLITDNEMRPGMSGVELIRRVRGDERFAMIPIALMSGRNDVSNEDPTPLVSIVTERPGDSFGPKPVSVPHMLRTLTVLVGR